MKRIDVNKVSWLSAVLWILGIAVAFAVGLMLHGLTDLPWRNWRVMLSLFLLFSAMGAYYGTIVVFDGRSGTAEDDRPVLRTLLCGGFAALIAFLVQAWHPRSFDLAWLAASACVGAVLGYFGWRWAKYVDF